MKLVWSTSKSRRGTSESGDRYIVFCQRILYSLSSPKQSRSGSACIFSAHLSAFRIINYFLVSSSSKFTRCNWYGMVSSSKSIFFLRSPVIIYICMARLFFSWRPMCYENPQSIITLALSGSSNDFFTRFFSSIFLFLIALKNSSRYSLSFSMPISLNFSTFLSSYLALISFRFPFAFSFRHFILFSLFNNFFSDFVNFFFYWSAGTTLSDFWPSVPIYASFCFISFIFDWIQFNFILLLNLRQ